MSDESKQLRSNIRYNLLRNALNCATTAIFLLFVLVGSLAYLYLNSLIPPDCRVFASLSPACPARPIYLRPSVVFVAFVVAGVVLAVTFVLAYARRR